jgi:hypothetical protein
MISLDLWILPTDLWSKLLYSDKSAEGSSFKAYYKHLADQYFATFDNMVKTQPEPHTEHDDELIVEEADGKNKHDGPGEEDQGKEQEQEQQKGVQAKVEERGKE